MAIKSLLNQYRINSVLNDPASKLVNYDLVLHSFYVPYSWEVS